MFGQLKDVENRFEEIRAEMARPDVAANPDRFRELTMEFRRLEEIVSSYREYRQVVTGLEEAGEIIRDSSDAELVEIAREEHAELEREEARLTGKLQFLLIPRDPNDSKNTIVEIRAGAGGEEAALFAADLYRMYTRYSESKGWRAELLSANPTGIGGFKEVIFSVGGSDVYGNLKYESGVHRVQRIPETESSGRIHTSTSTVAVLPEAEDVDIKVNPEEIRVDVYRSSGPGGQSVNTTDSAVRITHLPTGLIVQCQDEKSQHKNKAKALKILRSRLLEKAREEQHQEIAASRRSMVGSGDRSERIRTYNFPQSRLTDHRINLTLHTLERVLEGELDPVVDALTTSHQAEALKAAG